LLLPLPGEPSQLGMAPKGIRNFPLDKNIPKPAAVLMLFYPVDGEPYTVLMKRSEYPGAHSGQISLPGGRIEALDADLKQTALRETSEELGISPDKINVIGKLTPMYIPVSGFDVHPFLGFTFEKPDWKPDLSEVSYLIELSVNELTSPGVVKYEMWQLHGNELEVPFYLIHNEKIWGATAMIIAEFLQILKSVK
jgi:8-oxo-dGTP pyrophosphatase MutT (NUDIX family)